MADHAKNRKQAVGNWNYVRAWFGGGAQAQWNTFSYYRGFLARIRRY